MSGFSPDWLALREPADRAARSATLCDTVASRHAPRLHVIDLGAGTGANLRFAAPRLGGQQRWRLVDHDETVLAAVPDAMRRWAAGGPDRRFSLHRDPEASGFGAADDAGSGRATGPIRPAYPLAVEGLGFACRAALVRADLASGLDDLEWPARGLVSACALLDLVSPDWLDALAERTAAAGAAALFALSYDGRLVLEPAHRDDALVRALVNLHQRRDKGFGPALGPAAGRAAVRAFERRGYAVLVENSDWRIGPEARRLQAALVDGWVAAAVEISPADAPVLGDWRRRRAADIGAGRLRIRVGHVDVAAVPRPARL